MKKFVLISGAILACTTLAACAEIEEPVSEQAKSTKVAKSQKKKSNKAQMTSGQENALESAQRYVDMTGFSKKGLIRQLSSSAGEGFDRADATYAANHVDVNWKDEAVEAAQSYLDVSSFSKDGLIQQLSSSAGSGFTRAQAQYAVGKVY